jgi:outer membrane protein TolC
MQIMLDTLARDASAAVAAGVTSRNDLLKVHLKQSEAAAAALQLQNGIELATRALCQYMGGDYDSVTYLFDTLPLDTLDLPAPLAFSTPHQAAARRSESRLLELGTQAAQLQKRMALGEALPQVALGATYGYNNLTHDRMMANGLAFATVSIPLTAWWETAHNVRKEEIMRQKAYNTRRDMQEKLVLQTLAAWNQMKESYTLVGVRLKALEQSRENLTEVKNYFDAGMNSMKDYLEAQALLHQTQGEVVDQIIDYLTKRLQYKHYVDL